MSQLQCDAAKAGGIDVIPMIFLILTPILGIAGTAVYTAMHGFHLWMPLLAVGMYGLVGMSVCAGYHRFFSHKSYEASPAVQILYAIFGAMAAENSILQWSSSHRLHHQHVDRDWDPYSIKRGFWWAHIVWIFYRHDAPDYAANASDLMKNPVVMWQHRWYRTILIVGGFGLPAAIGAMFGDPLAGLLWGGFTRVVVIHHTTFFVNSLAHYAGKRTYNADVSARDNWAVALLTLGEGYHSFHHRFPADFRNGLRWYQWDPAKWFIRALRATGLAGSLRSTTPPQVQQARFHAEVSSVEPHLAGADEKIASDIRRRVADAKAHLDEALALWRERGMRRKARQHMREARRDWKRARIEALMWGGIHPARAD